MAAAVYLVHISTTPGVQYAVGQAEYEQLSDLGLVTSLDSVTVSADQIFISDGVPPASPAIGLVWFNRTAP
jgi:hypothetical protein